MLSRRRLRSKRLEVGEMEVPEAAAEVAEQAAAEVANGEEDEATQPSV